MQEIKAGTARGSFWCGILTAEKQAATSSRARTVRGPYTASNLANSQRDKSANPDEEGPRDGKVREKG